MQAAAKQSTFRLRIFSIVLQATFILKHVTNPKAKRLLNAIAPGEPSPKCAACGTARLELLIDTSKASLDDLVNKVSVTAALTVSRSSQKALDNVASYNTVVAGDTYIYMSILASCLPSAERVGHQKTRC